jgi:hemolysin III
MYVHEQRRRDRGPEELASSLTHGLGLVASLVGLPVLVLDGATRGDPWQILSGAVYGTMLVLLYGASTLYHALPPCRARQVCRFLDHAAIFLLIAGTYTPFTLGPLRGPWGFALFGVVWALAAAGIALKARFGLNHRASTGMYVAMGWLILVAVRPLGEVMDRDGVVLLLAGGALYTLGVAFYAAKRVRWSHVVWHLLVMGGSACHFLAVLWFTR